MIKLIKYKLENEQDVVTMITELINYHRKLTKSRKEFYQDDEESKTTLEEWLQTGEVLMIHADEEIVGFFYVKYGGNRCVWLEDLFIKEIFRGRGIGKKAMSTLDDYMKEKSMLAMFVDVIPRNTRALDMYIDCGFDHLNLIQLRKNYDETLNKIDEISLLGHTVKKY